MLADFKTLAKHSLIYGVGIAVGKAASLLMVPIFTRYLSTAEYGRLELLNRSGELLVMSAAMGIVSALPAFFYQYESAPQQRRVVVTGLLFTLGASLLAAGALFPWGSWLSRLILGDPRQVLLCRLLLVTVAFDVGVLVPLMYLRIERRSLLYTVFNITHLVGAVALNTYFVVVLRLGLAGVMWSTAAVTVAVAVALGAWTLRRTGLSFDGRLVRGMLRYGLPLVPAGLMLLIMRSADRFFLDRLVGASHVGVYALGYKFGMILQMVVTTPLMLIWNTYIFEIAGRPDANRVYGRALTYYSLAALAIGLPLSLFGREVVALLATPGFREAYRVIPLVALSFVLMGAASVMEVGIYLQRRTELRVMTTAAAASGNLVLNYLLVPRWAEMGAGLALVGSFGLLAVLTYLVCRRLYPVPYEPGRLGKLAAVVAAAWVAAMWLEQAGLSAGLLAAGKLAILAAVPLALYLVGFFLPGELAVVGKLWGRKAEVGV